MYDRCVGRCSVDPKDSVVFSSAFSFTHPYQGPLRLAQVKHSGAFEKPHSLWFEGGPAIGWKEKRNSEKED